jgi:hypothetical protein
MNQDVAFEDVVVGEASAKRGGRETRTRGRAVDVEPEDVGGIPAGEPSGRDRRTDPVTLTDLADQLCDLFRHIGEFDSDI